MKDACGDRKTVFAAKSGVLVSVDSTLKCRSGLTDGDSSYSGSGRLRRSSGRLDPTGDDGLEFGAGRGSGFMTDLRLLT
jgi:hypothetical protein